MWTAPAATVLVGGLAYLGARTGVRQRGRADQRALLQQQREEWGRRFEMALAELAEDNNPDRRFTGRLILQSLAAEALATDSDRALARALLTRAYRSAHPPGGAGVYGDLDEPADRLDTEGSDKGGTQ